MATCHSYLKPAQRIIPILLSAITPSFLSISKGAHKPANTKLHPTAYLSGLRGIAAVIVCCTHYMSHEYRVLKYGYQSEIRHVSHDAFGYKDKFRPTQHTHIFLQLPLIRILVSASAMVKIFFIVSGFSISYGSIKALRRNDHIRLYEGLSSSIFRRGFRLYLPIAFYTFWTEMWACLGLYNYPFGGGKYVDSAGSSITARLFRMWYTFQNTLYVHRFSKSADAIYNGQLWTIPVEHKASLVVYLTVAALANFRQKSRLLFEVLIAIEVTYAGSNYIALFMYGLILAELHHIRLDWEKTTGSTLSTHLGIKYGLSSRIVQGVWMGVAVLALYLMSSPENSSKSTGYQWLSSLPLSRDRIVNMGCILLIFSADISIYLQPFFTTTFAQYLGDISYSLYIVHIWVLQSFRNPIMSFIELALPGAPLSVLMILQAFVTIPLNIWIADMFWRFVDEPSVSCAKWLFKSSLPCPDEDKGRPSLF